jgi:hypothetical protein
MNVQYVVVNGLDTEMVRTSVDQKSAVGVNAQIGMKVRWARRKNISETDLFN